MASFTVSDIVTEDPPPSAQMPSTSPMSSASTTDVQERDDSLERELLINAISKKRKLNIETSLSRGQSATIDISRKLKVSPPKTRTGEIADNDDIEREMKADGFGQFITRANTSDLAEVGPKLDIRLNAERILRTMYGREYFKEKPMKRRRHLEMMIDKEKHPEIYDRALRFVNLEGDVVKSVEMDPQNARWKKLAFEYGLRGGEEGWNAFAHFGAKWIQRVQNAGTCFLHAPVVTQSYLVRGQLEREAIDIQKYARATFVDAKVEAMILHDGGGNAFEEIENMLGKAQFSLGPIEAHSLEQFRCRCGCDNEILHLLKSHGPALVHVFKVDHNFRSTTAEGDDCFEIPFLTGTIGKVTEKHAMVLVGMRKVSGAWRYLLQNWWPKLQLVEVSEEYFRSSDSSICFVTSKVSSIDKKFALCNSVYAESSLQSQDGNFSTVYER